MPTLRQASTEFPDSTSRLWRVKSKSGPDGTSVIRYASFISQLKRIALQFNLQLQSTTLTSDGVQRMAFAWRLTAECFSIQLNYHKCSSGSTDCESTGGGSATFDEFVTITSVLFEFNHDKILPCSELIPDLNSGNFDSLSQHVTNLVTVYAVPGNKIDRARAYMCLEAIEQDLSMLSQVSRSPDASVDQRGSSLNSLPSFTSLRQQLGSRSDVFALRTLVNQSMVGHFVGRSGGRLARLTYLVTPAQAAVFRAGNSSTGSRKSSVNCSIVGKGSTEGLVGGHMVRVGLRPRITYPEFVDTDGCQSSGPQQLAFIPLVTLQEDAHGNRLPDFAKPDDITCVAIEAEFVLYLDPPVPLTSDAVHQLQHITGLTDSDFGILDSTEEQDLVQVILSRHGQQHLYGINSHLQMPNMTQHSYEIRSSLRGFLVSQIPFTCSNQLSSIISLLRQHASTSAFLETFVLHPRKPVVKDDSLTFHFAVTIESTSLVHVQFDHPCDVNRTVQLDIEIGQFEVERATLNCDHYISDENQLGNPGISVDPLPILARSHALPVGLVWVLTSLGCPTHRQLPLMITKPQQPYRDEDGVESNDQSSAARFQSLTSPKLLGELRSMLARARSHVIIQDATGTGGVLSGADRFAALDLEAPLMPTTTVAPTSGLKMAPLPPGVLATPPPMFSNSEGHPGDLVNNVLSNVRYADFPARSHPNVMHSASSPQTSFNPRSLRLDDLLIDNLFQQCPGPSASADHISTGSKSATSTVPGGTAAPKQFPGTRDLGDSLSSPPTLSVHAPLLGIQAGVFSSSSLQVGPQQSSGNANYPLPPYAGRTGQTATPPAVPLSIPGTFTQTPILVSQMTSGSKHPSGGSTSSNKSSTSNSGSMLVNLLNEDPLPPSNPALLSHLPHPPSSRGLHLSSSQTAPMIPGVLDSSRESFMPNRLQSSAPGSSPPSAAASGMPSPISQTRSVPTTGSQHITTAPPGLVTPKHSAPQQSGLRSSPVAGVPTPSSTIAHKTIPTAGNIQTSNTGTPTISKKPRKRRRGSSDGLTPGTFPKSGSLVSSTPQSVGTHGMKHQRIDTPTCQHPTYHRNTYGNPSAYSHVASTVTSPSQSNLTALPSVSHSSSVVSSGKSVYDFDDTASSMFELSSSSSVSSFSGSTVGASATKISSSSGASYSASGSSLVGAPGPPCAQVSANAGVPAFERTVERKTSLKISIKTLPPQRPAGKSAVATSCIVKQDSSTAQTAATEGRVKLTASGQPVKKRKRRSVDGKPSSYVLQMLQNSGGPGNVSDADGSTSAGLTKSSKCSTSLSHATLIVKKERKRRAAHGSDRFKPLPPTTPLGSLSFSSSGDGSGSSMEEQKARKLERMIREGETPPQVLKVSSTPSSSGLTMATPIKGPQTQTGVQKKKPIHAASPAVPEDSVAVKRPVVSVPSSSLAHPGEYKRKKCMESSKSFLPTSYSLPQSGPSGSESEFTNTMTISGLTSGSTHSIPVGAKVARSSHLGVRGGASTHGGLKRAQTASPFLPVSTSVPASSHASGGIIKGYKIPKKKSTTAGGALPPPILSDDRLSSTVPPFDSNSKGTLDQSTDSAITEPCSSTTATSSSSFITTLTSITTSQPGSPIQASPVTTQQGSSTPSKMVFTTSGSGSVLNPFGQHQQQQNRRQSVKSISDIVDKLRAKSTTGNNSSVTPSCSRISGVSKLETNNELLAVTESEQSNSPIGPLEIIGASNERDTPQDPRGDNIFEKFSIETPNSSATTDPVFSNRVSLSTASLPQGTEQDNLSASSPKFLTDDERQEQGRTAELSDGRHQKSEFAGLESDEDVSVGERNVNLSGSRPTGQYVVIKAQTDTPASPAESCTTAPSTSAPTSTTTSKIIPISSPNGTQRLHASHSRVKASDRHGGPLISRKTACNPMGSRFPRPSLGSVGPISHVGPEGYMRSATAGRLRRPARGYPHTMHRPKTATFKGPSVWSSSGGLEFGSGPPASQGDSVQPVVGAPWMMSQGGGPLPAPTTGPSPFPSSSVAPPPPMPHSFHTAGPQQRPLRPLFGPPGGVNLYGGPMRGAGKQ
ncbi:mediator of RNA polymerase II transcription subunit 1 [Clonorchis sinensis]|uniref:Mediator of RNA polymerase II transcription subunit 1 n=1 Tax=Clonorchis sinensis TaxID=79923 RepID=H2KVL0_CLOSI|nr:mediator of RNA polymerase II transcription subunit 1 [Clonorchis sinensis]